MARCPGMTPRRQAASYQRRIQELTNAEGDIVPFANRINHTVVKLQVSLERGIPALKAILKPLELRLVQ